jgi:nucleoside 2-deoxyribosyltransferase
MKIYIAAPYPIRDEAISIMHALEAHGHVVTSTWLRQVDTMGDYYARLDLADVDACDMLLFYQPDEWVNKGTGGRHVEFGYAIARKKLVVMIGPHSNIFHYLDSVLHLESIGALLEALKWK